MKWARVLPSMNRGSIYTPSFKTNRSVLESALCGVIGRSGQGDRTLRSVLPATEPLSCDRTLTCVRSALTGRVRSQKLLFGPLLMLTECWSPESDRFAVQRPVSNQNLTSVRSALTGHVRSGFSLSGTLLELTGLWHPATGHISLSVRSHPDDFT